VKSVEENRSIGTRSAMIRSRAGDKIARAKTWLLNNMNANKEQRTRHRLSGRGSFHRKIQV
jgi:hypothetical protein